MSRLEDLADAYGRHVATPWQRTIAGAQRVVMVVYDKEQERMLRARRLAFETATTRAGYAWLEVDLAPAFAEWMAGVDYREEYFAAPEDLRLKLDAEFPEFVADRIRRRLTCAEATEDSVVAVFGAGALFGLARVSHVLGMVEGDVRGRLVLFFPGQYERNNYRLLDARDGWNYLAVPIAPRGPGERR